MYTHPIVLIAVVFAIGYIISYLYNKKRNNIQEEVDSLKSQETRSKEDEEDILPDGKWMYSPLNEDFDKYKGHSDREFGELRGTISAKYFFLFVEVIFLLIADYFWIMQHLTITKGGNLYDLIAPWAVSVVVTGAAIFCFLQIFNKVFLYKEGFCVKTIRGNKRFLYDDISDIKRHKVYNKSQSQVQRINQFRWLNKVIIWDIVIKHNSWVKLKSTRYARLDKKMKKFQDNLIFVKS